ncbi:MAG: cyclic nucleotide-binding domain-containing protein [Longimicrobiales bacterium]|nr:cyclic nucleotide-binding domain-containing protein [Longimicrobiales bacterium]
MLDEIIPFRYLTRAQRSALADDASERVYEPDEPLIRQGDSEDRSVFLLLSGRVRVIGDDEGQRTTLGIVDAGHYLGERATLFEEARRVEVRAVDRVRALTIPGERFLSLVHESTPFAQSLGNILRDKQGIFAPFDHFRVELLRQVARGSVDLGRLLPLYEALQPALHPKASDPDTLDIDGLAYAVRRLPENVTRTLSFYVTDVLPALYSDPATRFPEVPTAARRRAVYQMLPGKNMVLVRDGVSDLVDLICCLCLYAIEARKIRRRVRHSGGLDRIPEVDAKALEAVWPTATEERIRELSLHHEDFRIEVHKELDNYNSAHAETWCKQIAAATRELLGHDPVELPDEVAVHVVSSNTHSVHNCLSPWMGRNASRILSWAEDRAHPLLSERWNVEFDLVCALARDFLDAHPQEALEREESEKEVGIHQMPDTAFTGIAVQLIDATRVRWDETDPGIPDAAGGPPALIVNIDYAFGEQAEHIIANLVSLFGRNLTSVNVLGKAGGLVGERGDVLVADGFVEQHRDHFHPIPGDAVVDVDRLRRSLPDRKVHPGNLLTVTGTLMQNRTMLHFNRHIWRCIGLEMEGACYLRHLVQSMNRGSVASDVDLRFIYYTSDLPLRHDANLSARLRAAEGVPPLYAATREVLTGILEAGGGSQAAMPT